VSIAGVPTGARSLIKGGRMLDNGLVWASGAGHLWAIDRSDEERAIGEVVERLAKQFPRVPADEVAQVVKQSRPEFDDVPIRESVPLFVERGAEADCASWSSPATAGRVCSLPTAPDHPDSEWR
jgi:hypothetical protein